MNKGHIEIFQSNGDTHKSIFKGSNMVVDGFRKTIADVMTYMPNPSGGAQSELGASSVSSYQVQAMTLGSAKQGFSQRDSRFWYSGLETSADNYQLLPVNENATFAMWDCYSSIGFNQWNYDSQVDANLLTNPTLENLTGWTHNFQYEDTSGVITQSTETLAEGKVGMTKFTVVTGQQQVTIRQRLPQMAMGHVYTLYTNGKAHNATMDIRISRGRNDIPLEYYDFDTHVFTSLRIDNAGINHTIQLKDYYDVDKFRFKLHGNERDQLFLENDQYFIEYIFPSVGFIDKTFAPWDFNYVNPYINILRLELCDEQHQILQNPNFLDHQSNLINNDFDMFAPFTNTEAKNPTACAQAGLHKTPGWTQLNPLAMFSNDPGDAAEASGLGAVFPLSTHIRGIESGQRNGVAMYVSSISVDSSGAASIQQSFNLGSTARNQYAFADEASSDPTLLGEANGQYDNNTTLMLSFDTMVSGEAAAADCGYLNISLTRDSDDFEYNFGKNAITFQGDMWTPYALPHKVYYNAKNTWSAKGVQVVLPADANNETYTLTIQGTGRTDGTKGFCYYLIKNFSFGSLAGWRTYVYDYSGTARWSLSSLGARVTPDSLFSGLTLSATQYNSLAPGGSAYADIQNSITNPQAPAKTQLVQNFVGLEPTKTYRVSVKGTSPTNIRPGFKYSLKAKARAAPGNDKYNIFGTWMTNSWNYSATNTIDRFNQYSTDSGLTLYGMATHRATFPFFSRGIGNRNTTPLDWGVYVQASGTEPVTANSITSRNNMANPGSYVLSMRVFNETEFPAYFVLSSTYGSTPEGNYTPVFFNWKTTSWDQIQKDIYGDREEPRFGTVSGTNGQPSSTYFLPLPGGVNQKTFTPFTFSAAVPLPPKGSGILREYETAPMFGTGGGTTGLYAITAAIYGSPPYLTAHQDTFNEDLYTYSKTSRQGRNLISDIALKGPGLGTNVDIWKELYYNFEDRVWQPKPVMGIDNIASGGGDYNPASFISTPQSLITGMCLFGLDRDTEYQLNIIDTSGGNYTIHDISLTDTSLVANSGKSRWIRDARSWTSEPYTTTHFMNYNDGAVFKWSNQGSYYNSYNLVESNYNQPSGMYGAQKNFAANLLGLSVSSGLVGTGLYTGTNNPIFVPLMRYLSVQWTGFTPWLTQNFTLGEYNLKTGDTFAVGLEGLAMWSQAGIEMSVNALYDGVQYNYDPIAREWTEGRMARNTRTTYAQMRSWGYTNNENYFADNKTWQQELSPPIIVPPFGPNTKIVISFYMSMGASPGQCFDLKNFKVYKHVDAKPGVYHVSGPTFNFPEFPSPTDITLQPSDPEGTPGQLGQFLNRINFFNYSPAPLATGNPAGFPVSGLRAINNPMSPSVTGEKTLEEAVVNGAYLPSAGLYFGSGTYGEVNPQFLEVSGGLVSGVLNQMGVVNSDGYIYRHPFPPTDDDARDASAGFIVSSFTYGAGPFKHKTMRYILKVERDDWRFLDYYMGGLGAMGLNTLNYKETYKKLGTAFQLSGTGASYSPGSRSGLYKIADPSRNPIFHLTNKKVMFPSGLKIDYNNTTHITIIWDINY